jgi:radical SAM protein with 4Fe4S-binding SPASM domain
MSSFSSHIEVVLSSPRSLNPDLRAFLSMLGPRLSLTWFLPQKYSVRRMVKAILSFEKKMSSRSFLALQQSLVLAPASKVPSERFLRRYRFEVLSPSSDSFPLTEDPLRWLQGDPRPLNEEDQAYLEMSLGVRSEVCWAQSCLGETYRVDEKGTIAYCPHEPDATSLGNIHEKKKLVALLENPLFKGVLTQAIATRNDCEKSCGFYPLCRGGCPRESKEACLARKNRLKQWQEALGSLVLDQARRKQSVLENILLKKAIDALGE